MQMHAEAITTHPTDSSNHLTNRAEADEHCVSDLYLIKTSLCAYATARNVAYQNSGFRQAIASNASVHKSCRAAIAGSAGCAVSGYDWLELHSSTA